jgi:hypothetical protein
VTHTRTTAIAGTVAAAAALGLALTGVHSSAAAAATAQAARPAIYAQGATDVYISDDGDSDFLYGDSSGNISIETGPSSGGDETWNIDPLGSCDSDCFGSDSAANSSAGDSEIVEIDNPKQSYCIAEYEEAFVDSDTTCNADGYRWVEVDTTFMGATVVWFYNIHVSEVNDGIDVMTSNGVGADPVIGTKDGAYSKWDY